jgi:hypothetical protein
MYVAHGGNAKYKRATSQRRAADMIRPVRILIFQEIEFLRDQSDEGLAAAQNGRLESPCRPVSRFTLKILVAFANSGFKDGLFRRALSPSVSDRNWPLREDLLGPKGCPGVRFCLRDLAFSLTRKPSDLSVEA